MRKPLLLFLTTGLVACHPFAEPRDWEFVQAVGGMAIDAPVLESGSWTLPVRADVSGLTAITNKPTALNSALICRSVKVTVEEQMIYLTIETDLTKEGGSPRCPPARLGRQQPGEYTVMYRGPNRHIVTLGDITIAATDEQ